MALESISSTPADICSRWAGLFSFRLSPANLAPQVSDDCAEDFDLRPLLADNQGYS